MNTKVVCFSFCSLLTAVTAVAVPAESLVGTTGTSAVVKPGEKVEFYAAPAEVPQKAVVLRNGKEAVSRDFAAGVRPELSVTAESGVWYLFRVTREGTAAPQEYGVICDPLSIRPATERPADFDTVWAAELAEMRKVPMKVLSWKKWPDPKPGFESAEIAVSFLPGLPPVTGWISWPTNAAPKSLKMVVGIPGAGYCGYGKPLCGYVDGAISFFPNVHGVPNQDYDPRKWDAFAHETGNYFTRESWIAPFKDCYYRKVVLRIIRGFDYLKTLEKWNGRDLDLSSASQGGALSVIAAALVPEITSVRADVTAMCDHGGEKLGRQAGWPQPLAKYGATAEERARGYDQLRYLDVCHFAPRVKCPVTVFTGLQDTICSPTSVFAMFNSLPATTPRKITVSPLAGHAQYGRKTETAFETVRLTLEKGDRIVVCGDSITFHSAELPFGFYHQLTNVFAKTCPEKELSVAALGFSGAHVGTWTDLNRRSYTQEIWTHFRKPGWSVSAVLSNKVDALVVFLGMNDILMPSMDGSPAAVEAWGGWLRTLVRDLRKHTGARKTVLCTTTPLTADPASPKNIVRLQLGEELRKVAAEENCGVADFGKVVMDVIDDTRRFSTTFQPVPDFVHPQKLGHLAMARELCRAFGETKAAEILARDYAAELAAESGRAKGNVAWRLHPLTKDAARRELSYRIEWFWHDTPDASSGGKSVTAAFGLPEGWSVDSRTDGATSGEVTVKGVPDRLVNPVTVTLKAGALVKTDTVPIATPWRVSSGWDGRSAWRGTTWQTNATDAAAADAALKGPWTYVTGTYDYKGGVAPGSLDPYQATFGTTADSLWAVRTVVSEKARDVKGLLSHTTFSISGGFTLYVNGERVFADFLDRNGKGRSEVPAFRLRKGANEIRLRADHSYWERQFSFDLVPCAGDDLSDLRYLPSTPRSVDPSLSQP